VSGEKKEEEECAVALEKPVLSEAGRKGRRRGTS